MADVAATPVSGSEEVPAAIRTMRWFIRHPPAVTFLLVVIVCIVVGTINPDFWQVSNLFDMARSTVVRGSRASLPAVRPGVRSSRSAAVPSRSSRSRRLAAWA